jgi:hypothetical protein
VEISPYLLTWKLPRHSMRAAAGEVTATAKSAATASVAEPRKTGLYIGFPPAMRWVI